MISKLSTTIAVAQAFRMPLSLKKNQHPRVMGTEVSMTNYNNDQYYGTLYWGSASQSIDMLLDTGSSKCWIPMDTCPDEQCPNEKYATSDSTTFVDGSTSETLVYGSGEVTGTWDTDRVCLDDAGAKCSVDTFKFLGVSSA